jgi:hypothetical protein
MYTVISIILLILLLAYAWYRSSRETHVPDQVNPKDLVNGPVEATENPENGLQVVEELEYPHEDIMVPKPEEPVAKPKKSAATKSKRAPKKAKD